MAISKFKATCLAVLERVRKTKKPILVTRFGEPIAEAVPPSVRARRSNWMGSMAERVEILEALSRPLWTNAIGRHSRIETAPGHTHLVVELA